MITRLLALLLSTLMAPACSPKEPAPARPVTFRKVILLTDSTAWHSDRLPTLRRNLTATGDRVLVSGDPDETAVTLAQRLPWLLQPGVDAIYYDLGLAGQA